TRSALAHHRAAARPPARPRPKPMRGGARAGGIRWDRMGRVAMLCVLVGMLFLYIKPARSYFATWQQAKHKRAEVSFLRKENARLRARRAVLSDPHTLELQARRMGMVRPGERAYVVKGLPHGG